MSTKILRYTKIYHHLQESIDFEKAQAIPLKTGIRSEFEVEGIKVGMSIEEYSEEYKDLLGKNTNLYNRFKPGTYFNLGFDIDGITIQVEKKDYHILSKILGIVVKSTLEWIEKNKPEVITVFGTGETERESKKKLSIYGSILQGNAGLLHRLGYIWERGKLTENPGRYEVKRDTLIILKYH